MPQGKMHDGRPYSPEHWLDDAVVDRIIEGKDPGRRPSQAEVRAAVRRMHTTKNLLEIAAILHVNWKTARFYLEHDDPFPTRTIKKIIDKDSLDESELEIEGSDL